MRLFKQSRFCLESIDIWRYCKVLSKIGYIGLFEFKNTNASVKKSAGRMWDESCFLLMKNDSKRQKESQKVK